MHGALVESIAIDAIRKSVSVRLLAYRDEHASDRKPIELTLSDVESVTTKRQPGPDREQFARRHGQPLASGRRTRNLVLVPRRRVHGGLRTVGSQARRAAFLDRGTVKEPTFRTSAMGRKRTRASRANRTFMLSAAERTFGRISGKWRADVSCRRGRPPRLPDGVWVQQA